MDITKNTQKLYAAVKELIDKARQETAVVVNTQMTLLYWHIGKQIKEEVLNDERGEYGKKVIKLLSEKLTTDFGRGWSEKQLRHFVQFTNIFPDIQIVYALCRQLSWSHLRLVMYMDDSLKRDFYLELSKIEGWSTRQLQGRIKSMLYERTAISKKPEKTIEQDLKKLREKKELSPDFVFRDPYFFGFLGLSDTYSERDLETAILAELQRFIIEMGTDFAFLARQKRIVIDHRDYYIDLLFYHRRLKCLVAIDLKIGEFDAAYKGQMELYLRYLEKYEVVEGENTPIGLILCTGKNEEHVELLQLDKSNIRVADYLTQLPSQQVLKEKLHRAIELARNRFVGKK